MHTFNNFGTFLFSGLNGYLENVLEKFKLSMKEGIPSLGIPSFDPFHISELDFPTLVGAYGPYGLNVDINMDFNNLSIGQLSTYDVTYVDANLNQLSLDLQVDHCQKHAIKPRYDSKLFVELQLNVHESDLLHISILKPSFDMTLFQYF